MSQYGRKPGFDITNGNLKREIMERLRMKYSRNCVFYQGLTRSSQLSKLLTAIFVHIQIDSCLFD